MIIYLIRNKDLSKSRFNKILSILNFNGNNKKSPIKYQGVCLDSSIDEEIIDRNDEIYYLSMKRVQEKEIVNPFNTNDFKRYFDICNEVREREKLDVNHLCILLTNELNQNNFFTWCDFKIRNIFIQTSQWELVFEDGNKFEFAIIYEINAWVLRSFFFENSMILRKAINKRVKGNLMDLCRFKDEMSNKMKTAEIPENLLNQLTENNLDRYPQVNFIREQFENIRLMLLNRDNSKFWFFPVTLRFTHNNDKNCIVIEELGNKKLDFELSERVIYRLLLEVEEGIHYDNLNLYKKRIYDLFCLETTINKSTCTILSTIKNKFNISFSEEEMERYLIILDDKDILELEYNNPSSNEKDLFNQKISRINGALNDSIPSGIVQNYRIVNVNKKNKYKIYLDRNLVKYDS
jgi:hypothetical protein